MRIDLQATRYEFNNGRFDLMTDDEVRTLTSRDLEGILVRLSTLYEGGESTVGEDLYHRLYELSVRYPSATFHLEIVKEEP